MTYKTNQRHDQQTSSAAGIDAQYLQKLRQKALSARDTDDVAFKLLMTKNPDILKELLEIAFKIRIQELVFVASEMHISNSPYGKQTGHDLLARDNHNRIFNVEMQNNPVAGGRAELYIRSMVYFCNIFNNIHSGTKYIEMPHIHSLSVQP